MNQPQWDVICFELNIVMTWNERNKLQHTCQRAHHPELDDSHCHGIRQRHRRSKSQVSPTTTTMLHSVLLRSFKANTRDPNPNLPARLLIPSSTPNTTHDGRARGHTFGALVVSLPYLVALSHTGLGLTCSYSVAPRDRVSIMHARLH